MAKQLVNIAQLHNIWVVFQTPDGRVESLRGVDTTIPEGCWTALIGDNGSGKSTLCRVLCGLTSLSRGSVGFANPACSVRMVFQNPVAQAIGETVFEDVCYQPGGLFGDQPDSLLSTTAFRTLERVGLDGLTDRPVDTLSGGQRQRLAMASALMIGCDLLVLDEVTTMLDPRHRGEVLEIVRSLVDQGTTVVTATQRMEEVAQADHVIAMQGGRVAFEGNPREFFYGPCAKTCSPCEQLGFSLPRTVSIWRALMERTARHDLTWPLTPAQLQRSLATWH